jgi:hypothetical protein
MCVCVRCVCVKVWRVSAGGQSSSNVQESHGLKIETVSEPVAISLPDSK